MTEHNREYCIAFGKTLVKGLLTIEENKREDLLANIGKRYPDENSDEFSKEYHYAVGLRIISQLIDADLTNDERNAIFEKIAQKLHV